MRTGFRTVVMAVLFVSLVGEGCKKKKEIPYPDYTSPKNAAVTFARAMERDDVKVAQESSIAGGMEVGRRGADDDAAHTQRLRGGELVEGVVGKRIDGVPHEIFHRYDRLHGPNQRFTRYRLLRCHGLARRRRRRFRRGARQRHQRRHNNGDHRGDAD